MTDLSESPPSALDAARATHERMRVALELARQRAAQTEIARADAERAHVESVADALCAGQKTPAKPATLSAVQAADDAADSALEIIEKRLAQSAGELKSIACDVAFEVANACAAANVARAHSGYEMLMRGFSEMVAGCGLSHARLLVEDLAGWGQWPDPSLQAATAAVRQAAPEAGDVSGILATVTGEHSRKMPGLIHHDYEGFARRVAELNQAKKA